MKLVSRYYLKAVFGAICVGSALAVAAPPNEELLSIEANASSTVLRFRADSSGSARFIKGAIAPGQLDRGFLLRVLPEGTLGSVEIPLPIEWKTNATAFFRVEPGQSFPALGTNFAWIPPGTFVMGSPPTEGARDPDEIQTVVTLTDGFWIGRHEVTQGEFESVMGFNPSRFVSLKFDPSDLRRPVETVAWADAVAYCDRLTLIHRESNHLSDELIFRLPTEAEWEYACRAGTTTAFAFGPGLSKPQANFLWYYQYTETNPWVETEFFPLEQTTAVGSFPPNALGLYDMHGNVWEWCLDWTQGRLPGGSVTNPIGIQRHAINPKKIVRGGSWEREPNHSRSANRSTQFPYWTNYVAVDGQHVSTGPTNSYGFRVVLARPLELPE